MTATTASAVAGTNLGIGTYLYRLVYRTGQRRTNSQVVVGGSTNGSATITATTTSGNQAVQLNSLPTSWPATVTQLEIYRTPLNGAEGTEQFVIALLAPQASWTDTLADASLGAAIPTVNTTGTYLGSLNALNVTSWIASLLYFSGSVMTSRGGTGTFTRGSPASNPETLAYEGPGIPSFVTGYWGDPQGAMTVWEGTTQLAMNSGFETVTTTAVTFNDPISAYTGSSASPVWTIRSGSFTFAASGGTCGALSSLMTAGNASWKPLSGSDGTTNCPLIAQATFTTSAVVSQNMFLQLYVDGSHNYELIWQTDDNLVLYKTVAGTGTALDHDASAITQSASTTYTFTLSIDHAGSLTANLYSGTGTGGALLQTLTATDTTFGGGFLVGVGGDPGVLISDVQVTSPMSDTWSIGGDTRVAWAVTTSALLGTYSVSGMGLSGASGYVSQSQATLTPSVSYTMSVYASTTSLGTAGAKLALDWDTSGGGYISTSPKSLATGTHAATRYTSTVTSPATAAKGLLYCLIEDTGTVVIDSIQLEQKAYTTPYFENDSTSASATRTAETLYVPTTGLSTSAGGFAGWFRFDNSMFGVSGSPTFAAVDDSNAGYGIVASGTTLTLKAGSGIVTYALPGALSVGTWAHIAVTWDATTVTAYVGGQPVGTTAQGATALGSSLYVGNYNCFAQMDGAIDDLVLFRICPSAWQIATLYAASQPPLDAYNAPTVDPVIYSMLY